VPLLPETVERVRDYWRKWQDAPARFDTVSVVVLDEHRFAWCPDRLRSSLARALVTDLDSLVATLGDEVERVVAAPRLCYADASTVQLAAPTDRAIEVPDDDLRFVAMTARAERAEWKEAGADEPCDFRYGIVERDALMSVATLRVWNETLGHIGVYTDIRARRRGLARIVASAAVRRALRLSLVPQWRVRIGNEASLRVAGEMGFVSCGRQFVVRIRASSSERSPN
jgi:RimJ/RimL family protein N-acetyltransferase